MKTNYTSWMETEINKTLAEKDLLFKSILPVPTVGGQIHDGFYNNMLLNNTIDWLEWAMENTEKVKTFNLEEMRTLMSMLKSKDKDNVYMGLEIIKNKIEYNEH